MTNLLFTTIVASNPAVFQNKSMESHECEEITSFGFNLDEPCPALLDYSSYLNVIFFGYINMQNIICGL